MIVVFGLTAGDYGYITTKLTQPLIPGHRYYIENYVRPASSFQTYGISVSALLTVQQPGQHRSQRIPSLPNFQGIYTSRIPGPGGNAFWVKVSGYFYATDAAEWLTLGTFDEAKNIGAHFNGWFNIDDVLLRDDF